MEKQGTFQAIVDRIFEPDEEFLQDLVSWDRERRRSALSPYFAEDPDGLETALETLNRIVESPTRDVMSKFVEDTDGVRIAC